MEQSNFDENKSIPALISQFERMLKRDDISFFDLKELEEIFDYYDEKNQIEKALEVSNIGLSQHGYSASFYIKKAHILSRISHREEALELLDKAIIYDASDIDIYLLKSNIFLDEKDFEAAIDILNEAYNNIDPQDKEEIYLAFANVYEEQEAYDKVFYALRKTLRQNPDNEEGLDRIWSIVEFTEKYDESIALHNWVLDENPYSHQAWFNLGHTYLCKKEYNLAEEAFDFAFTINEKFGLAYREGGETNILLKDYTAAINCYTGFIENIGFDADIFYNLAYCFEKIDEYKSALEVYLQLSSKDPQNSDYHFRIGNCYLELDKEVAAITSLLRAIELEDSNALYYATLGEAYIRIEEIEEADKIFRKALELDTGNSEIWVDYVSFLVEYEEYDIALEALKLADEYCDSRELDYSNIGVLYLKGRHKEAMILLQVILEEDYDSHYLLFELFPEFLDDHQITTFISIHKF